MTHAAELLKETGPAIRARPMQYINTSQQDLDSYLQLTQAVRLRVGREEYTYFLLHTFRGLLLKMCELNIPGTTYPGNIIRGWSITVTVNEKGVAWLLEDVLETLCRKLGLH